MPDNPKILQLIVEYKDRINKTKLKDELYKWELIKKFQGKPDLNAKDFVSEISPINYSNLIYQNARQVKDHFLRDDPESYRKCLGILFNEEITFIERVKNFDTHVMNSYRKIGGTLSHHHDERTAATFLTYKYPEKYTFYMSSFYQSYCKYLDIAHNTRKGEKYSHYLELINDLSDYIKKDNKLLELVNNFKSADCYEDPLHKILAQDILYQMFEKDDNSQNNFKGNYWTMSLGENSYFWEEFYDKKIIAIGWDSLGNLSGLNKEEIEIKLNKLYPKESQDRKNDRTACFDFANTMNKGDLVFIKKGKKTFIGVGKVESDYYFDDNRTEFKHTRIVSWIKTGNWNLSLDLATKTLTQIIPGKKINEAYVKVFKQILNDEELKIEMETISDNNISLNTILYGPPGTGKTYRLKNDYFEMFTEEQKPISIDDIFRELADKYSWWQLVAAVLYETENVKVP
ncbi:MAG: hypothetical protein OEZ36_13285, partial [Spirochaetota bacterium]|nr:hypothetical protein [Spirochaetota bacterium]